MRFLTAAWAGIRLAWGFLCSLSFVDWMVVVAILCLARCIGG
jgi:hypothetical protein